MHTLRFFFPLFFLFVLLGSTSQSVSARENVTDWYIKDFRSEFVIHPDSTMTVTEWILADCGLAPDKHGIFRIVPTANQTDKGLIKTPVELKSITDFSGKTYPYEVIESKSDHTLTWKIGDKDKVVTGVNEYKIVYEVKNVVRTQDGFDEWYWNLLGTSWDIPIDAFQSTVRMPQGIHEKNSSLSLYTGKQGNKDGNSAEVMWLESGVLIVTTKTSLEPEEGVTLSLSFPQGIVTPYHFSWWERYGGYFWLLIPLVSGVFLYRMWKRHGDDPTWNHPEIAEYEVPKELNMLTSGVLLTNGWLSSKHITAAIVELGVRGIITLRKESKKVLLFTRDAYFLEKKNVSFPLAPEQKRLVDTIFATGDSIELSSLKGKFHAAISSITQEAKDSLIGRGLFERLGFAYQIFFVAIGIMLFPLSFFLFDFSSMLSFSLGIVGVLFMGFGAVMTKRTVKGVETLAKLKGVKLYMETAEKYRQQFFEKEGMFEMLLPAAFLFGITKEWIEKIEEIYGKDYFTSYHPAWFVGSFATGFNTTELVNEMNSISHDIAANMGTGSGSSGSGSSGGGSGGGGGGGW